MYKKDKRNNMLRFVLNILLFFFGMMIGTLFTYAIIEMS
jgi:hypothetical protein